MPLPHSAELLHDARKFATRWPSCPVTILKDKFAHAAPKHVITEAELPIRCGRDMQTRYGVGR